MVEGELKSTRVDRARMSSTAATSSSIVAALTFQMCQCLGFKPLPLRRRDVETQIDGHLDLVTAILAKPDMTDFVVAHIRRPLWCDQEVIAFAPHHSRARTIVHPSGRHDHLPDFLGFLWRVDIKAL